MKLITKELAEKTPRLYETEYFTEELKIVQFKLFDCMGNLNWYIIEYDPKENLAFGLVDSEFPELDYIPIDQLESLGWRIERDLSWKPRSLAELRQELN